ncbi:aldolase [Paraburkholderia aspalathi]|uniref:aldolase n=1 Tax=Paraburkholderia aspalathi TaxID=1324617 RepID=UPI0038BC98EB
MTTKPGASKAPLMERAHHEMNAAIADASLTARQKLALTCRILFDHGHDSGLAGQITFRSAMGRFYTQALGLGFDEVTPDNLLEVDEDLRVQCGAGMANPANRFHAWIYRARPDVNCIIHTHPLHVAALSMIGQQLIVSQMDLCPLYDDCAYLAEWPGVPVGNEEGEIISGALGKRKAILLAHHGQLVAGRSIEEACVLAILIERAARLQLLAGSAGTIRPIPAHLAIEAREWITTDKRYSASFAYYARQSLGKHLDMDVSL